MRSIYIFLAIGQFFAATGSSRQCSTYKHAASRKMQRKRPIYAEICAGSQSPYGQRPTGIERPVENACLYNGLRPIQYQRSQTSGALCFAPTSPSYLALTTMSNGTTANTPTLLLGQCQPLAQRNPSRRLPFLQRRSASVSPVVVSAIFVFPVTKNDAYMLSKVYCYCVWERKFLAVRRVGMMTHREYRVGRLFPVT